MQIGSKIKVFTLLVCVIGGLTCSIATAAQQQSVKGFEFVYVVDYNGMQVGSSARTVVFPDRYSAKSTHRLKPGGMALLLGEKHYTQESSIEIDGQMLRSRQTRLESDDASKSFTGRFNWRQRVVEFDSGSSFAMPDNPIYDFESWLLSLMLKPSEHMEGRYITIVERPDRIASYQYREVATDLIDIKGQSVEARKFTLQDIRHNKRRGYSVWIIPEYYNLIAVLVSHRGSNNLRFEINHFDLIVE